MRRKQISGKKKEKEEKEEEKKENKRKKQEGNRKRRRIGKFIVFILTVTESNFRFWPNEKS